MTDAMTEAVARVIRKKGEYHWVGSKSGSEYVARAAILETLRQIMEPGEVALDSADDVFHDEFQKQMKLCRGGKPALASGPFIERIWRAVLTTIREGRQ